MKKFFSSNEDNLVNVISTTPFISLSNNNITMNSDENINLYNMVNKVCIEDLKLGIVCNWNQQCGISTYSKYLVDSIKDKVNNYKIFSEYTDIKIEETIEEVYCWKRGENLNELIKEIKKWKPNFLLIQHEWGLFPNAAHFMKFIIDIEKLKIPYLVTTHSIYYHLDKTIPLSVVKNISVHSQGAKNVLEETYFQGNIHVIPHGCVDLNGKGELWNIFKNPYTLFGFGFGFKYKGVDIAIDAINYLKNNFGNKYKDILYIYVCSESENNKGIHNEYYNILNKKVEEMDLENNIILIKGFINEKLLENYLRTVKLVLFPYIQEQDNIVYGASGAIKIAMSYNIPVIASKSHLFDDLNNIVPKISNSIELAQEIDKIFSDENYKNSLIEKNHQYILDNSWENISKMYLKVISDIRNSF